VTAARAAGAGLLGDAPATAAGAQPLPLVARIMERPARAGVAGALTIAFSAILMRLAKVEPATAAIFRCVYALPALGVLAWLEDRRFGPREARARRIALPAGIFYSADLILWGHAIQDVGAGLATVLGNLQVVIVPFAAWALLSERIERRVLVTLPLVASGVLLISGALEHGAYGAHPLRGVLYGFLTGLTYAGFILVLRRGSADLRRPAGPLFDATLAAAAVSVVAGLAIGEADLVPHWPAHGWLLVLALSSQVLGWLLITVSLPRLPAALTSVMLTIQPVGSVMLGVLLLGEHPSALQLCGVACIVAGLVAIATRRAPRATPPSAAP
jgi:drug/metabolite transporter (DMT)-like permease